MPQQQDKQLVNTQEYKNLLQELKDILAKGHHAAYKAVDNIRVQTYWQMGERIVREELKHKDRADYGEFLIANLSVDLQIAKRNLYRIVKFYRCYQKVVSLIPQLSWTHYYWLVDIDDSEKREFYERQAVLHSWSVRELQRQIKNKLYEKTPEKEIAETFRTTLPAVRTNEIFRDTYDFSFIELEHQESEKALEDKTLSDFEKFLQELGEDFAILGRQQPIKIDNTTHYIDLVLYHRGIPCVILVDLKIGTLDSRDIGQMNKYIGYYRRNKQYEHEKDTIGLIICKEAGKEEVMYALDGLEQKIFIAKYKVKLPSEEKIKKAIQSL
ncbi:DUF1016 family protein [bacterium]|nr:DUF1016 family protein [bacterium]